MAALLFSSAGREVRETEAVGGVGVGAGSAWSVCCGFLGYPGPVRQRPIPPGGCWRCALLFVCQQTLGRDLCVPGADLCVPSGDLCVPSRATGSWCKMQVVEVPTSGCSW